MKIFIEDSFDSAHWLPNVPKNHKCHALHGHTYKIRLEVSGKVGDTSGWVVDYADVKIMWESVKVLVDHRCLNEIPLLENPTCEHLAMWMAGILKGSLPGICRIEIRETERCGVSLDI
jgi:6-pyruvoyltetrahydropterin/6-carboxytetrahydropterin synthase